jgi:Xaa-Pro aminopeptidase
MERRMALKGMGATAAAAAAGAMTNPAHALDKIDVVPVGNELDALRQPLLNKAQAQAVMEEYDLAGMLALNPVNIYYLTNTTPIGTKMRWEYPAFATLPRDLDQPTFLITNALELWDIANGDRYSPDVIPYSGPLNTPDYIGMNSKPLTEEPMAATRGLAVRDGVTLNAREQGWADSQNVQPSATPEWALARAMKESGIVKGRVAVDDMRIAHLLQRIGVADNIEFVDGDNLFRRIRYIKSEPEIALMRLAGAKNAEAALATARSIEKGMSFHDIERRFLTECALRGNAMSFIIAGVTLGFLPDAEVVPGKPFLIDAVSNFHQYHGDFARSIVLGEPSKEVVKRANAQQAAREATFSILKPGTKYSDIHAAGYDAFKKAGGNPDTLIVNPHSLGLQHTDQPYDDSNPWRGGEDIVLKAGMVITVDLPYIEIGFGAGHNEDLVLITEYGYEAMNSEEEPLIIV